MEHFVWEISWKIKKDMGVMRRNDFKEINYKKRDKYSSQ
jgi:hypothetical protein